MDEQHKELGKFIILATIGFALVAIVAVVSPSFLPEDDPQGLQRSVLFVFVKVVLAVIGLVGSACGVNWITKGDWWAQLEEGNIAVGIATAGAFIGIGYALSGAV